MVRCRWNQVRTGDGRDALTLYRVDRSLVLRVLTGGGEGHPAVIERATISPLSIEDDRPFSLALTIHGDRVQPYLDGQAMKEIVLDQPVTVEADIFMDGHDVLAAELHWRAADQSEWQAVPMSHLGNDRWSIYIYI